MAWPALAVVGSVGAALGVRHRAAIRPASVPTTSAPGPVLRRAFERGLDSLGVALDRLETALATARPPAAVPAFRAARAAYKRVEVLLEAFAPAAAEALNGPPPEASEDKPYLPLGAPAGFQVIESAVFSDGEAPSRDSLRSTVRAMRRVAGFDTPGSGDAVAAARRTLPAPLPLRRLWRQNAATVFERGAFKVPTLRNIALTAPWRLRDTRGRGGILRSGWRCRPRPHAAEPDALVQAAPPVPRGESRPRGIPVRAHRFGICDREGRSAPS